MNVAPSGFPTWRSFACGDSDADDEGLLELGEDLEIVVFRRKSCVTAMPIEAKESDVRSQARKVLSKSPKHVLSATIRTYLRS